MPLLAVAALMLAACGGETEQPAQAPQVRKAEVAKPADPTAKMARAVTVGKSSVPVDLKYEIAAKPMVGEPIEIELAIIPALPADSMGIAFAPSPGLTLSAESAPNIEAVKGGVPHRVTISAQGATADVFYLTVTTTLYTAGTSDARTFAIPLIVSDPATEAAKAPEKKS